MKVREVLDASREAAIQLRTIDEEAQRRREAIGPQGHGYEPHPKIGILDPMRKIDELLDYEELQRSMPDITGPIDEAWEVVSGIATIADELTLEVVNRYYLVGESWNSIARDLDGRGAFEVDERQDQVRCLQNSLEESMGTWESIGIAHLKEMGRDE